MKTIQLSFIVAVFIIVTVVGLSTARTVEAAAAPVNQGVPSLQNAVNTLQDTVNSLRRVVDGIKANLDGLVITLGPVCSPPDLVPKPLPGLTGPTSFCQLVSGHLKVVVYNQGGVDAGTSTTRVVFNNVSDATMPTVVDISTPPVVGFGGSQEVLTAVDVNNINCFDDTFVCKFKIFVDFDPSNPSGAVVESDETNNSANGECSGVILF